MPKPPLSYGKYHTHCIQKGKGQNTRMNHPDRASIDVEEMLGNARRYHVSKSNETKSEILSVRHSFTIPLIE